MRHLIAAGILAMVSVLPVAAQGAKEAIKKIEAEFEPAQAKPGETVLLKLRVELQEGYYTYPVFQPDDGAKFSTNKITFPTEGSIIYVADVYDPVDPKSKKEGEIELLYYPGGGTYTRKAVVSPLAKAGDATSKLKMKLIICDKNNCFPPRTVDVEAKLKIQEGKAVEVEKKYQAEVEKALKK